MNDGTPVRAFQLLAMSSASLRSGMVGIPFVEVVSPGRKAYHLSKVILEGLWPLR